MFRAILELLITIFAIVVARAVLTGLMRGIANAASGGARGPAESPRPKQGQNGQFTVNGELHRDPVCGTFVSESTPVRRTISGRTFYYCSESCREKHSLAAR